MLVVGTGSPHIDLDTQAKVIALRAKALYPAWCVTVGIVVEDTLAEHSLLALQLEVVASRSYRASRTWPWERSSKRDGTEAGSLMLETDRREAVSEASEESVTKEAKEVPVMEEEVMLRRV